MGIDLHLESDPCKECGVVQMFEEDHFSYTYNVSQMWYEIYPESKGMIDIDGMQGADAYNRLANARNHLEKEPDKFIAMNPPNGWGSYEGLLDFINRLISASLKHPHFRWRVWR